MKKNFFLYLTLLSALGLLASCNEKISPELENASATNGGTIQTPSTYYFRVVDSSEDFLGYHLHRTGPNNSYKNCEISKTTAFTSTAYSTDSANTHDNKVYDISCFFEAEELALYFSGLKMTVESSKNTCDYIGYAPYSYYKYMPGSSTRTVTGKARTDTTAGCQGEAPVVNTSTTPLGCGDVGESFYADESIAAGSRVILDDSTLCTFDYTEAGGPNCDPGVITINQYTYSYNTTTLTTDVVASVRQHQCGGAITNCIAGAITEESKLDGLSRGTVMYRTELNENFSLTKTSTAPILEQGGSNISVVNFRRDLANKEIDYGNTSLTYVGDTNTNTNYLLGGFFNTADFTLGQTYAKRFDPLLIDRYSAGLTGNGVADGDLATARTAATTSRGYRATPYASDAFLGMSGSRTNPFYAFYCFDKAFEVRARIRIMVRDWDQVFYTDTNQSQDYFALISDIDKAPTGAARIHNPVTYETTTDNSDYNAVNDIASWEDILYMQRDGATYIFKPDDDYFSSNNFPGF